MWSLPWCGSIVGQSVVTEEASDVGVVAGVVAANPFQPTSSAYPDFNVGVGWGVRLGEFAGPTFSPEMPAGASRAEIEAVFLEAMFAAFERNSEPTELDVAASMSSFVPLSRLMAEQIAALKQWSVGRARPSTSTSSTSERKLRKLGV